MKAWFEISPELWAQVGKGQPPTPTLVHSLFGLPADVAILTVDQCRRTRFFILTLDGNVPQGRLIAICSDGRGSEPFGTRFRLYDTPGVFADCPCSLHLSAVSQCAEWKATGGQG